MTKQDNSNPQASVAPTETAVPAAAPGPAPTSSLPGSAPLPDPDPVREPKSRDGLIVASILIVSVAVSVMCLSQLGLSLPVSGAIGAVTLALLMLVHKQMQKTAQIAQLKAELARTRQSAKPRAGLRAAPAPSPAPQSAEARIRELSRDIGNLVPRAEKASGGGQPSAPGPAAADPAAGPVARKALRMPSTAPSEAPAKPEEQIAGAAASGAPLHGMADGASPNPHAAPSEPVREQWSFRPRNDAKVSAPDSSEPPSIHAAGPPAPSTPVVTTIEGDLELVQRKIKELADEVNAAEALRPKPPRVAPVPASPPSALEDSIGALKAAAKKMRARPSLGDFVPKFEAQAFAPPSAGNAEPPKAGLGELVIPASAERIAGADPIGPPTQFDKLDVAPPSLELRLPDFPPPGPALSPHAAAVARAIDADAMDILLGPIVTLAEHSVSHYEMSARLRSESAEPLNAGEEDFVSLGGERAVQFDIARLNRAASLAARMEARDREGSLLADFLGTSMASRAFLEAFAHAYEARPRISSQLVLTFSQRAVDAFSPQAWQAVRDMHAFGFRLALDRVQHMGTDFAGLQRSGFRFVRLGAQALLEGMATPERFIPADEILQRATLAGLSIIASGIQDAGTQKRLLDAGVLLGQGPLFGAARQVNIDNGGSGPADQSAAA